MTYKVCLACGRLEDDTEIRERIEAETIQKKLQELEQLKRENMFLSAKAKGFTIFLLEDGVWKGEY